MTGSFTPTGPAVWDCHTHVFGPWTQYPLPENPRYRPEPAPFGQLLEVHRAVGISHGVIVQAAPYGSDHRLLADALAAGGGRYRGIALVTPDSTDESLVHLHRQGVRGARLGMMSHLGAAPDLAQMRQVLARIQPYGWHALVHAELADVLQVVPELAGHGVPLLVDHMARLPAHLPGCHGLDALLRLAELPDVWVKLSGADRITQGRNGFEAALRPLRALIAAAPDRLIWGSDWPHVNIAYAQPKVADLLGLLRTACGDADTADRILRKNPERLYA